MARRRPSLPSRSVTGWYGASLGPGATAAPNSAPSAGASGADEGPPPAPAGGGVALELARRHPDRVGGLVLAGSIGPGEPTVADRLLALPVAGRAISAGGLAATRLVLRRPSFHGIVGRGMKGVDPNHVRRFVDDCMSRAALDSFMVEQRALVGEWGRVVRRLGELRLPTVVVSGERDRMIAPTSARRLAEAIPGAELRIVPGAGHFLPGASPSVLAEAVVSVAARAGLAGR